MTEYMRAKTGDLLAFWDDERGWPDGWSFEMPSEEFLAVAADPSGRTTEVVGVEWSLGPLCHRDGDACPGVGTFFGTVVKEPDTAKVFAAWARHQNQWRAAGGQPLVETLCN